LGLDHLGAAHLAAVPGDEGIERHVLRLERRHAHAVLQEDPAEGRREHTLARVGTGALDHQGGCPTGLHPRGARRPQLRSQSLAEPRVLVLRAYGDAEEPLVKMLVRGECPDGDPLAEQTLGQFRCRPTGATKPHQQEVRHAGVDHQPRKLRQCLAQPVPLSIDQGDSPPGIVVIGQEGHRCLLRQEVHRPWRNLAPDATGESRIGHGVTQPQTRDCIELPGSWPAPLRFLLPIGDLNPTAAPYPNGRAWRDGPALRCGAPR
jgi:hypothetical protein